MSPQNLVIRNATIKKKKEKRKKKKKKVARVESETRGNQEMETPSGGCKIGRLYMELLEA